MCARSGCARFCMPRRPSNLDGGSPRPGFQAGGCLGVPTNQSYHHTIPATSRLGLRFMRSTTVITPLAAQFFWAHAFIGDLAGV